MSDYISQRTSSTSSSPAVRKRPKKHKSKPLLKRSASSHHKLIFSVDDDIDDAIDPDEHYHEGYSDALRDLQETLGKRKRNLIDLTERDTGRQREEAKEREIKQEHRQKKEPQEVDRQNETEQNRQPNTEQHKQENSDPPEQSEHSEQPGQLKQSDQKAPQTQASQPGNKKTPKETQRDDSREETVDSTLQFLTHLQSVQHHNFESSLSNSVKEYLSKSALSDLQDIDTNKVAQHLNEAYDRSDAQEIIDELVAERIEDLIESSSVHSSVSSVESLNLKDRQAAINTTHPFGIKIWKPSLYKKNRSVAARAEEDIHDFDSKKPTTYRIFWGVKVTNVLWTLTFGLFLYSVCVFSAFTVFVMSGFAIHRPSRPYVHLLLRLGHYWLRPFGKFVLLKKDDNYLDEDVLDGRSISEFHRWRLQEEGRLFYAPPKRYTSSNEARPLLMDHTGRMLNDTYKLRRDTIEENDGTREGSSSQEINSPTVDNSAIDDDDYEPKKRLFGRGSWSSGRLGFYLLFWGILQPVFYLVGILCWMLVFTIPMAKISMTLCDHLRRHPLALKFEYEKDFYKQPKDRQSIIMCTYRCSGWHYYKYTIDGTNIFFINLLAAVLFVIVDYYVLKERLGWNVWFTDPTFLFGACLFSIIPLAYFIGQAVASISAQSSMGLGAVINAFFSTVVEIFLYCVALNQSKGKLVEGSMIGSILGGVLLLPGLSMIGGAFKRKTQRYNPRSAGVSSTMLLFAMVTMFAPSLFYQIYGAYEIRCKACENVAPVLDNSASFKNNPLIINNSNGDVPFYDDLSDANTGFAHPNIANAAAVASLNASTTTPSTDSDHELSGENAPLEESKLISGGSFGGSVGVGKNTHRTKPLKEPPKAPECTKCRFIQPSFSLDSLYFNVIQPFSLIVALALFAAYVCGLIFTLRTHASLIWATSHEKEEKIEIESPLLLPEEDRGRLHPGRHVSKTHPAPSQAVQEKDDSAGGHDAPNWSRNKSTVILLGATLVYAVIAEILVDNVDDVLADFAIDPKFLGLTVFALVPNTTEFLNAISFATSGNVALSMEIGSAYALQVVLIQIPSLVLFSIYSGFDRVEQIFALVFPRWDIIATLISIYLFTYIYAEGKSNYFKGVILILIYVVVLIGFWFNDRIESLDDEYMRPSYFFT